MITTSVPVFAQKSAPALTESGVDAVTLKGGPRILGAILKRSSDGAVALAVQRDWLKIHAPRLYEQQLAEESETRRTAIQELRERLGVWLKERPDDKELQFFLAKEAQRIEKLARELETSSAADDSQFMVLEFTAARIERLSVQQPARKQIALLAWRERLADIEQRSTVKLAEELKERKIDPVAQRVDLSDRLPVLQQDDREWSARRAIVEYQFRKPADFQGTGDVVVRTGDGAKAPDFAQIIGGLLRSQLADLIDPGAVGGVKSKTKSKWLDSASKIAAEEDLSGFRVTQVDQDLERKQVTVETRFVARMPGGAWETVWLHAESADASKPRGDAEGRIAKDPQVRRALDLARAAGVGDEPVQLAIRFGAAVMEAQQGADARFFEFRDRYLKRLESPVLFLPEKP